ncbi:glutamate 5-kinase [Streptomyces armeniacus]|uniref:Glutamate 5-kinase n=1 Tax=Streptomyces armeniacus TaxID=83291 RepID=A0A345XM21_9ACTN|nr:glutamate 5-kinase [Streptomyces armeniacus]AXK32687.1 glutamate 5-kinase [Streptomyces armeniacus]
MPTADGTDAAAAVAVPDEAAVPAAVAAPAGAAVRAESRRVVVKTGTSSLVTDGSIDPARIESLADAVADLATGGYDPVLVTSGAIALGAGELPPVAAESSAARQIAAAVGQGRLYEAFRTRLEQRGLAAAQFLLTPHDVTAEPHAASVREALGGAIAAGLVPVVNENDAIMVRNNDILAALLSAELSAGHLVLMTDVPGICETPPRPGEPARRIPRVEVLSPEAESLVWDQSGGVGTGGMTTKLCALWIGAYGGARSVITGAAEHRAVLDVVRGGDLGTVVRPCPTGTAQTGRLWRALSALPRGQVWVDSRAGHSVAAGEPVMAHHVLKTAGDFTAHDVVDVRDQDSRLLARGRTRTGAPALEAARSSPDPAEPAYAVLLAPDDYVPGPPVPGT